jgi:hypothetical protein
MIKTMQIQVRLVVPGLLTAGHPVSGVEQKYNSGWLINLDKDLMAEQDCANTGGVAVTLSGRRVEEYPGSLEGVRNWLDELLRIDRLYAEYVHFQMHSLQYGAMQFTPGNIIDPAPISDDRPYGSLLYIFNTLLTVASASDTAAIQLSGDSIPIKCIFWSNVNSDSGNHCKSVHVEPETVPVQPE